jgi:hypothetical protein
MPQQIGDGSFVSTEFWGPGRFERGFLGVTRTHLSWDVVAEHCRTGVILASRVETKMR